MLVNLNGVLPQAKKNGYGVGLFNTVNLEMAQGVIRAAEESRSPIIIGSAEILLGCSSLAELAGMLLPMAKSATVPVVLHYDHGLTEEKVKEAISWAFLLLCTIALPRTMKKMSAPCAILWNTLMRVA